MIETGSVGYIGINWSVNVDYRSCYRDMGQPVDICESVAVEIVPVCECARGELQI
jgi:hypothetical protein